MCIRDSSGGPRARSQRYRRRVLDRLSLIHIFPHHGIYCDGNAVVRHANAYGSTKPRNQFGIQGALPCAGKCRAKKVFKALKISCRAYTDGQDERQNGRRGRSPNDPLSLIHI